MTSPSEKQTDFYGRNETNIRSRWLPGHNLRRHSGWLVLSLAALLAAGGCSQKTPVASAPPPPASPPAAAGAQPAVQPDLPELNRSLLRWMMGHHHPPKDFEEFAGTAGVTIPPPPAGKKYFIRKDMHIVLVDR